MDFLDRQLAHDHWASTQLLELSRSVSDTQLDQPFDIGHGTLRETLDHLIFVIDFWTTLMAGQLVVWERDNRRSITELIERHERFYTTFAALSRQMRDENRLDDTFVDFYGEQVTFGGAIVHVVLHNVEHRAEALHILQRLGLPNVPELDHALWDIQQPTQEPDA